MARKPRKASRTEWHQHNGLWSRSLGNRGMRLRLFEKRSGGGFYRSVWIPGRGFDRKSLGTTDRNEADRLGRALLAALLKNEEIAASGLLTLGDLWGRYKRDAVSFLDNREKTRRDDVYQAQILLGYFGEECDVSKLTEADQLGFIRKRLAGGIPHGKDKNGKDKLTRAVRTRAAELDLKLLGSMLRWATTVRVRGGRRLLDQNPLTGIRTPREKNPRRPVATFERFQATRTAIQQLTAESTTDAERRKWLKLELALVMAEATGRRLGSIRQLAWSDIDFNGETIRWRADTDKKGKEWAIPLAPSLRDELKAFRLKLGGMFGGLIFPSESDPSEPIRSDVFAKWLRAAEERAGLPKLAGSLWHCYRRKWATERKKHARADVMVAGGWTDPQTLERCYWQSDEESLLAVVNEPRKLTERVSNA